MLEILCANGGWVARFVSAGRWDVLVTGRKLCNVDLLGLETSDSCANLRQPLDSRVASAVGNFHTPLLFISLMAEASSKEEKGRGFSALTYSIALGRVATMRDLRFRLLAGKNDEEE